MTKKYMRKVLVSPSVDIQYYHIWVEDQGDDEATLKMAKEAMLADQDILMEDAQVSVSVRFSDCTDEAMDDQAITKEDGWCHVNDLKDDEGKKVELTSDRRYNDPNYEQSEWYRKELEKAGQQKLPLGGNGDG